MLVTATVANLVMAASPLLTVVVITEVKDFLFFLIFNLAGKVDRFFTCWMDGVRVGGSRGGSMP